jgi:hypothetical protein
VDTPCGNGQGARGICDAGDKCDAVGVCLDKQYAETTVACREASGCCDKPDNCPGNGYECSPDATFGPEKTCRASCLDPADPAEVCSGIEGDKDCPSNVILDDELCIMAGQYHDAGTVTITATPAPDSPNTWLVCPIISLANDWVLNPSASQPIKVSFSTQEVPGSAPGKYLTKYPGQGIVELSYLPVPGNYGLETCVSVNIAQLCPADGSFSLFFAIHLDVTDGTSSETAWAMGCKDTDGSVVSNLGEGSPFYNKKRTATQGWGKYMEWTPACPTSCPECEVSSSI